jgi:hypothetical protein
MKSAFKYSGWALTLAFFLLSLPAQLAGATPGELLGKREFSKEINKEFDITANGTTSLTNKYGKVNVKTWARNRVKITVTIIVNARNESSAEEVFERIDIQFSDSPSSVSAETVIESQKGGWFSGWSNDDNADFSINYEVYIPATNNLELSNKYGNAQVAAIEGSGDISVKYGNFELEGLGEDSRIYLGYGKGILDRAGDISTNISYSSITMKDVKDVKLETKYSNITISQAADVEAETKYDNYRLGRIRDFSNSGKYDNIEIQQADKVEVNSKYTNVMVDQLKRTLDLDMQYGGGRVNQVVNGFSEITLEGRHSDFKIYLDSDCKYRMDASSSYAGINYPSDMKVEYEVEKGTSHEVKGYSNGSGGLIKARLTYGGLKVSKK